MKEFLVSYEIKGSRALTVYVEDDKVFPLDWESMSSDAKDEWLYDNGKYSVLKFEDIDYGKAVSVLETAQMGEVK